ncbi:hypothetical protein B0H11DRAFT_1902500 [Mycena galericulata]|nr:hypothetical protein B0H11DRAFT_1902500 [Mycena galericulata]
MLLGNFQTPDTRSSRPRAVSVEHAGWNIWLRSLGSGESVLGYGPGSVSTWVLGDQGRNLASCNLCLGSGGSGPQPRVASAWSLSSRESSSFQTLSTWVLGDQGRNLASCNLCLGSGGSRFGLWGIKVATWKVATSVWALGDQGQGCNLAKLQPFFGFWRIGLSCDLASRILFPATLERQ